MKKEVVWVYGSSAVGKETFIRKITDERPYSLLKQFGWTEKKVVASTASLQLVIQSGSEPISSVREVILAEVPKLIEANEVVLIKSQNVDFSRTRPQRLKELLPKAQHRLIFVNINTKEVFSRWKNKSWWKGTETINDAIVEHNYQLEAIETLQGFDIIEIESNSYNLIRNDDGQRSPSWKAHDVQKSDA